MGGDLHGKLLLKSLLNNLKCLECNVVFQAIRRGCHEYYSQVIGGITPRVNVI